MKRFLVAIVAAFSAALVPASQALAWMDWCDDEPPLTVITPGGHHVTVNNFVSAPRQDLHLLRQVKVYGWAGPAEGGQGSVIHIFVVTPRGGSQYVRVNSSVQHLGATTSGAANWGSLVELDLTVPVD